MCHELHSRAAPHTLPMPLQQSQLERRKWERFGNALKESDNDSVTVRAVEDIPFERVRLQKSTQEEKKTAVDVATALAMGDKSAVGTRWVLKTCAAQPCFLVFITRSCLNQHCCGGFCRLRWHAICQLPCIPPRSHHMCHVACTVPSAKCARCSPIVTLPAANVCRR